MKVLIACEESQVVCTEFRKLGHEAYSCDTLTCSGGHPEWHIQDDVLRHLGDGWDLMIAHPPCTYLSYAGIRWFNIEKYGEKARERYILKNEAIEFFLKLYNAPINKICLENPRGFIMKAIKQTQIINPYFFGDTFTKPTCLWLKNLPLLQHEKMDTLFNKRTHVDKGEFVIYKSGKKNSKWYMDASKLKSKDRQKVRSKTFLGIAKAMAEQWGRNE